MDVKKDNIMTVSAKIILVFILVVLILSVFSVTKVQEGGIFSSGLTDTYHPQRGVIIERNPIRIIYFGDMYNDANKTREIGLTLKMLIKELDQITCDPKHPLNEILTVNINSGIYSKDVRGSQKKINIGVENEN